MEDKLNKLNDIFVKYSTEGYILGLVSDDVFDSYAKDFKPYFFRKSTVMRIPDDKVTLLSYYLVPLKVSMDGVKDEE